MAELTSVGPYIWLLAPLYSWRAAAGAWLMDQKSPGWYLKIDKQTLDPNDDNTCIIGQTMGNFFRNMEKVFGPQTSLWSQLRSYYRMISHGFCMGWGGVIWSVLVITFVNGDHKPSAPTRLKWAWFHQIDKRLAAAH